MKYRMTSEVIEVHIKVLFNVIESLPDFFFIFYIFRSYNLITNLTHVLMDNFILCLDYTSTAEHSK